ncbi:MAG: DUF4209 domain-containing protein [Anaerolineae bacterium]|nr:MAG: DUF4209 domain-containing protein [Anaerolineae bacterium]
MMLTLNDFRENDWQEIIANAGIKSCEHYHGLFRQRVKEEDAQKKELGVEFYSFLTAVASMWLDPERDKNNPLQPMMVMDGRRTLIPDDIDDNILDILEEVASLTRDAEMRARFADIIWLRRRKYQYGNLAGEAYIDSARVLFEQEEFHAHRRVERAIQLALLLNNKTNFDKSITLIREVLDSHIQAKGPLFPLLLISPLIKNDRDNIQHYIALCEHAGEAAEQTEDWFQAIRYWETKAEAHQVAQEEENRRMALLRVVEAYVQEAEKAANDTPSRNLAACKSIEEAIELLRRIGGRQDRVEQLHQLLLQYGENSLQEMKEVSVSVDVSPQVQAAINYIKGKTIEQALYNFALIGRSPKITELRKEAIHLMQEHPLQFWIPSTTRNRTGKVSARQEPDTEQETLIRNQMLRGAGEHRQIHAFSIVQPAKRQIQLEHHIQLYHLMPIVDNNPFVPPGQEVIYAKGLLAGFNDDFLVAAHLLIPQIEGSIRYLLVQKGVITSGLDNDLIQDEYPLNKIIYLPELKEILGEDIVFDLQGLLVERYGSNIRNLAAHGLMLSEEFFSMQIVYLWWLTYRLCYLPLLALNRQATSDQSESNQDMAE